MLGPSDREAATHPDIRRRGDPRLVWRRHAR